uniref:NADH dehydrogenase subunit 1 n=1 Tax=Sapajus apella macrocephalus TaxID=1547595 RepID=UPI002036EBE4|nr:NADH dehydrogenase subunit 1 [Sapajus apella macrocephalus]URH14416.1 NADH dehydrogenase subunit 1 [Sapajus apella macrocephalus]URH15079.1 NADH dehydrogenase subunit 1 [Sapajus apella macrocephalus]URH15118.1 NADH dehydrogenase subunit 1 [Sapajus apella macrocephalus]URH15144.1 NADH dehydrogenase subunit 1 [Sapajus apella macrocephalus]URH15157.1 NADH dehydrogenase subunit 1 [Sapajus apella macrocephalus]
MFTINLLLLITPALIAMAFLTLMERKILGYMQLRKGPNTVGPYGVLQPIADAMKLFTKEPLLPNASTTTLYMAAPTLALTIALLLWTPLPMPYSLINFNLGLLFVLATSSLAVYSILWSGWASNSNYALIGALRAVAQTISYEVTLAIILLSTLLMSGSFNLHSLITTQEQSWLLLPSWPLTMMWFISTLAETNRAPFDLTEGESELVSGFNIEYAAGSFALFFMAEYMNIIMMNALTTTIFTATPYNTLTTELYTMNFMTKTLLLTILFLWIRTAYPRFRYDQLMYLLWKKFLPLTLALCMWYISMPMLLSGIPPQT